MADNPRSFDANDNPPSGRSWDSGASLSDILTAFKDAVVAINGTIDSVAALSPHYTTGRLTAATLVQAGFVRVTGVSMLTAASGGTLNDAGSVVDATANTAVYMLPATSGFVAVNMIFANGLVYTPPTTGVPGVIFYTRT